MKKLMNSICGLAAASLLMCLASTTVMAGTPPTQACWGQATKVFAQTGAMGEHASQEPTPRLGLRNLARALFDAGILADDSMGALGQFVAAELDPSIGACMSY
jgi:hypothetical protein